MSARHLSTRVTHHPKKGGRKVGKTKRGKGTKIMAVADRNGLPVSVCTESATSHKVTLAMPTLLQMVVPDAPQSLIGDNAYDSDRLDSELRFYGIEVIAPHRRNRRVSTQDGRRLRRYRRPMENREAVCLVAELPGPWSFDMNVRPRTFLECFNSPRL